MIKRIAIVQGHPDPAAGEFGHALAASYEAGAAGAGHVVKHVQVAELTFPLLQSKAQWESEPTPSDIQDAQETIAWADHVVVIYPLWLGSMPALLKGFFEQLLRPAYAFPKKGGSPRPGKRLACKSARVIVTMGMPAALYRWYFRAHSLKSFERNILAFCGFKPVRHTLIGRVEGHLATRLKWLRKIRALGHKGA